MNSKQSKSASSNEQVSGSERKYKDDEIEQHFSEIESFNKAITHLKESLFGKFNNEITKQLNKAESK